MLKRISSISIFLCMLFSLVSCNDSQKQSEINERAYKLADISRFLNKSDKSHLIVKYNYDVKYLDEDDTIYNMLFNSEYFEKNDNSSFENRSLIMLDYDWYPGFLYFYPEQSTIGISYSINSTLISGEAERYYKVDETDFNTLYEKLEYCVANPNVEEKE